MGRVYTKEDPRGRGVWTVGLQKNLTCHEERSGKLGMRNGFVPGGTGPAKQGI